MTRSALDLDCAGTDADGRVRHFFVAQSPTGRWLTDITEHKAAKGKAYMRAIKDAFSGRVVGYFIDSRTKSRLVVRAINSAVAARGNVAGCIVHSDRGSQFLGRKVLQFLTPHGFVGSMGRVGAAGDNAAMEFSFARPQKNEPDPRRWATRVELWIAIVTRIERTCHGRRRQPRSSLRPS